MELNEIQVWTHWANHKEKRLFLIVDVWEQDLILMEIKEYAQEEQRTFITLFKGDFLTLVEMRKLVAFLPKI